MVSENMVGLNAAKGGGVGLVCFCYGVHSFGTNASMDGLVELWKHKRLDLTMEGDIGILGKIFYEVNGMRGWDVSV